MGRNFCTDIVLRAISVIRLCPTATRKIRLPVSTQDSIKTAKGTHSCSQMNFAFTSPNFCKTNQTLWFSQGKIWK